MSWLAWTRARVGPACRTRRSPIPRGVAVECLEARELMTGWRFDFGGGSSPLEAGFVRATTSRFSESRGWGWTSSVSAVNRSSGEAGNVDLTRDFHYGRDNTFRVNVANGDYDVVLHLGDSAAVRDQIQIDIEGNSVVTGVTTARGEFQHLTFRVSVADEQLTVRLKDGGGANSYWAINGLEVRPIATSETLATVSFTPGWATFGQALPRDAAFAALQIGSLETQTDIKTRWEDGSIRFAILTAEIPESGSYAITPAETNSEHLAIEQLPAEVRLQAADAGSLAALASISVESPDSTWLEGSLVAESRWSVVPTDVNGDPLSGMRVLFDQRTYRDGARRLSVTVENSDDTTENRQRDFDVQIWADADRNGLLDELLFDRSEIAMGSGTRFIERFGFGLTAATVTPDLEPMFQSGALPRYAAALPDQIDSAFDDTGALRPEFDLLGPGDLNPYMGSPGGRPEIAPYTDWTARFLVHRRAEQADFLLRMGDLAGSWPIHLREPSDGRLVSLAERPNFWFDDRGEDHMRSAEWGGSPLSPDNAHVPGGLVLVPYLLTGDRFYADEVAFWANYAVLSTWPGNSPTDDASRAGGDALAGSGRGILATNQVRGFAWGLRNLADAAAYLPDAHPMAAEFQRIVSENLSWLDDWARTHAGPLRMAWLPGYGTEVADGQRFVQLWMYDYLAWSIHHALQLGFSGGARFRDQVVRIQTELFVNSRYHREFAAPGYFAIGSVSEVDGSTRFYTSLRSSLEVVRDWTPPGVFAGYYGVEARLALLIGIETGADGRSGYRGRIRAALNFLNDATLHPGMFDDPLVRSGFGLAGPDHSAE